MNLEHLDDPAGFVPDDDLRAAVHQDGRRRRTRRRVVLAGGSVLTSMAVVVASLAGYGLWRTSQIERVDVDFVAPPVELGEPFNVLLIGSDIREGEEAEVVHGARSDTVVVVRVLPAERRLVLMSLPRDLVLEPTRGAQGRLAAAFSDGGAAGVVRVVEGELGIPLSAYVEVDFRGLVDLVDEVGGLPLEVSSPMRDRRTGLLLDAASCASLDGEQALALLRSRHLETIGPDGRWREDPSSDLGRMARQRAVLAALLPELGSLAGSLGGIDASLDLASDHLTIDDRLDHATLLALARWATEGPAPTVNSASLPIVPTWIDQAAVLVLAPGADRAVTDVGGALPEPTALAADAAMAGEGMAGSATAEVTVELDEGDLAEAGAVPFGACP